MTFRERMRYAGATLLAFGVAGALLAPGALLPIAGAFTAGSGAVLLLAPGRVCLVWEPAGRYAARHAHRWWSRL